MALVLIAIASSSLLTTSSAFVTLSRTLPVDRFIFTSPSSTFFSLREQKSMATVTMMAGFGASSMKGSKSGKEAKLKPKSQWDRYGSLKKAKIVRVAVRVIGSDNDWLEIGRFKSKDDLNTGIAVAKQRVLIADHAKRLFPLKVLQKDKVEWAYWNENDESEGVWAGVDKSVLDEAPAAIEKQIGFEGRPDPTTGFYCHYKDGKIVE